MSMIFEKSQMSIADKRAMERLEAENEVIKADNVFMSMITGVDLPSMADTEQEVDNAQI